MSKQAAPKLVHGALNVVWEKLETLDFLGVGTQAPPEVRWGPQGENQMGCQPQASNPFEIIHIRDNQFRIISDAVAARIESARLILHC